MYNRAITPEPLSPSRTYNVLRAVEIENRHTTHLKKNAAAVDEVFGSWEASPDDRPYRSP